MTKLSTEVTILERSFDLSEPAKTGVSLHCHTEASKEMLDFVPHYAEMLPVISYFWAREKVRYREKNGCDMDFSEAFWSPPLDPGRVVDSEKRQINDAGLDAMVSITDHDSIEGTLSLKTGRDPKTMPISFEWTVPFRNGFFHLGIHNLPDEKAASITSDLLDYTFNEASQTDERLHELFDMLNAEPAVLIVFNHPIWDIELVGEERHRRLLDEFLGIFADDLHALELNGFRSWSENRETLELAERYELPVVSGGDRHGCRPNTVINLTNARTFSEFTEEVRRDRHSRIAVMPEYSIPLHSRQLQSFSEILSFHDFLPAHRQRWFDRVFFDLNDGRGSVSLASHGWKNGGPVWLRWAIWTLGVLGGPKFRPVFRALRAKADIPTPISVELQKKATPTKARAAAANVG
jgi:predicted metal-dependent phosphoesterase TrpH